VLYATSPLSSDQAVQRAGDFLAARARSEARYQTSDGWSLIGGSVGRSLLDEFRRPFASPVIQHFYIFLINAQATGNGSHIFAGCRYTQDSLTSDQRYAAASRERAYEAAIAAQIVAPITVVENDNLPRLP
jgi:hypothetical protein